MLYTGMTRKWRILCLGCIVILTVLFAACGGASTGSASTASNSAMSQPAASNQSAQDSTSSGAAAPVSKATDLKNAKTQSGATGPQYLIKTLKVTMELNDTKKAANDIQTWMTITDPRAISVGTNYDPAGNDTFNISLTFSVQALHYPQVYTYLLNYAPQQKGHLLSFNETVQDVTNDYVDTQSRLQNLRGEQSRLQDLMSRAQTMTDVITVEQKLSDVEGQIETIEAHLNELTNQVTFYSVSILLQPISATPVPAPVSSGWNASQVFHDAFAASFAFLQGLITFLIWLLAFSIYIVPTVAIIWLVRRWYRTGRILPSRTVPAPPPAVEPEPDSEPDQPPVSTGTPHS
jgi:hypothetical protein